jgi:hypothetical protein
MVKKPMDGSRVREYLSGDITALLSTYEQFERLVPHAEHAGAAHPGEDGRYVEGLIRTYLKKYLPRSLHVSTGFILRPAVKTGVNGRERRGNSDQHSSQLDIIVHDADNYPSFQNFNDDVIVPPEGVVAILSVKKHLRAGDVKEECTALLNASRLCRCLTAGGEQCRGPFLALISMGYEPAEELSRVSRKLWDEIKQAYGVEPPPFFDDAVGFVGVFGKGSIFKARPKGNPLVTAKYVWHDHSDGDTHLGLQFVLTGMLSVYYDVTRNPHRRPGFTGFESRRPHKRVLGEIMVRGFR